MNDKIKKWFIFIIIILIILILIIIPYIVQWVLVNETIFPFNMPIYFSRETWFGFIASYLGAIGTVVLGVIALWQSKRYKELADKSSQETFDIQQELRSLSEKTMQAKETLKKIELAKYYPLIERIPYTCHGTSKKHFEENFNSEEYAVQLNRIGVSDMLLPISELVGKYNTYLFVVKNVSEKAIRNFSCDKLLINGKKPNVMVYGDCDISSGQYAVIAILNFPKFEKGKLIDLEMRFVFKNLVMDTYSIETEIIITFDGETPDSHVQYFNFPEIYKSEDLTD